MLFKLLTVFRRHKLFHVFCALSTAKGMNVNMKPTVWYTLVALTTLFLIFTLASKNIYFAIVCLVTAIYLDRYTGNIPLPKYFRKYKTLNFDKDKKRINRN